MRVPSYYLKFKCIADRCRHSCCVGWEIDVDERTLDRYRALTGEIGDAIIQTIEQGEGGAHFRLGEGERCPHLTKNGLCRIITALGEGYLCDICREHPRFYNAVGGVWECGLGLACEEAARVVLNSENYDEFVCFTDGDAEITPETGGDFDAFAYRAALYAELCEKSVPLKARLGAINERYGLDATLSPTTHRALFAGLEYLNESNRALFEGTDRADFAPQGALADACERFFAYLILRHASPAECEADFAIAVSMAYELTRLFGALASAGDADPADCARVISEELEYSEENTAAIRAALENEKRGDAKG